MGAPNNLTSPETAPIESSNLKNVTIKKQIGEGSFGAVYVGKWGETKIAMKSLKDPQQAKEFEKECAILSKLRHPNVVSFFGIHTNEKGEKFMIMEFVSKGSLDHILKNEEETLTVQDLLDMMICASLGMEFLETNQILHRDMACRNLLATIGESKYIVKVSDFGLSRDSNSYTSNTTKMVPIRWTSPEVLRGKAFTSKADVWSFGITMWEICAFAQTPFGWMSNQEIFDSVIKGIVPLKQPDKCPEELFTLITKCCSISVDERPNFSEVAKILKKIKKGLFPEVTSPVPANKYLYAPAFDKYAVTPPSKGGDQK